MSTDHDIKWMRRALELAENGWGLVSPNPPVGCVIVQDNALVGEGWHERYGGPHAEPNALRRAGDRAKGATAYVTLMPCAHHGKTPPCTDALIAAGIRRVVVAMDDPHSVSGDGASILRRAGIDVETGLLAEDAAYVMRGFLKHLRCGLPHLTLKYAMTLDGHIATRTGDSKWISSEESRARVQLMRAQSDAVLVGVGTALADDPRLTVRDQNAHQPRRVIIDSTGRLSPDAKVFHEPGGDVWIMTTPRAQESWAEAIRQKGGRIVCLPANSAGQVDLKQAMKELAAGGVRTVLCEGGAAMAGGLFDAGLVDEIAAFIAPRLCGGGPSPVQGAGVRHMKDALGLRHCRHEIIGSDLFLQGCVENGNPGENPPHNPSTSN